MVDEKDSTGGDLAHAALAAKLEEVRGRFLAGFEARVDELAALAAAARSEADPALAATARSDLARRLHSLAGSAPTIGLDAVGAVARDLEVRLARAEKARTPVPVGFEKELAERLRAAARGAS